MGHRGWDRRRSAPVITLRRAEERHHDRHRRQDVWLTFHPRDRADPRADRFGQLESVRESRLPPGAIVSRDPHHDTETGRSKPPVQYREYRAPQCGRSPGRSSSVPRRQDWTSRDPAGRRSPPGRNSTAPPPAPPCRYCTSGRTLDVDIVLGLVSVESRILEVEHSEQYQLRSRPAEAKLGRDLPENTGTRYAIWRSSVRRANDLVPRQPAGRKEIASRNFELGSQWAE